MVKNCRVVPAFSLQRLSPNYYSHNKLDVNFPTKSVKKQVNLLKRYQPVSH